MDNERISKWDKGLLKSITQFDGMNEKYKEKAILGLSIYQKSNFAGILDRMIRDVKLHERRDIEERKRIEEKEEEQKEKAKR